MWMLVFTEQTPAEVIPRPVFCAKQDDRAVMTDSHPEQQSPLLPRVARGEQAAVRECIKRYGPLVLSLVRRWLGQRSDTDDATQDIFIELWKSAKKYDVDVSPEVSFVAMIARRKLIDRYRRQKNRPKPEPLTDQVPGPPLATQWDVLDELQPVNAILQELPTEQRRVLLLAVCDGWTQQEIADQTGLPLGTVKTYVRRGLMTIRERCNTSTPGGLA
jgi:RNA polymerase sigma-70 factor (ECF subfamily)